MKANYEIRLKGFTIAEVLVALALTSISITLSYGTLNYVQKLFVDYKHQNKFLNQYTDLKNRLDYESIKAELVIEENKDAFTIKRDTSCSTLKLLENSILLSRNEHCDTFLISAKNIRKQYEPMKTEQWNNKLIRSLEFETDFKGQKFKFLFYKKYEAAFKLKLEGTLENGKY
jgi:prepilin-type N-terminal cleavage/methylation domain-containing protein